VSGRLRGRPCWRLCRRLCRRESGQLCWMRRWVRPCVTVVTVGTELAKRVIGSCAAVVAVTVVSVGTRVLARARTGCWLRHWLRRWGLAARVFFCPSTAIPAFPFSASADASADGAGGCDAGIGLLVAPTPTAGPGRGRRARVIRDGQMSHSRVPKRQEHKTAQASPLRGAVGRCRHHRSLNRSPSARWLAEGNGGRASGEKHGRGQTCETCNF